MAGVLRLSWGQNDPLAENVLIGTKGAERRLGLGLRATAGAIIPHYYTSYVRPIYSSSGVPNRTTKKFKIMLDFLHYYV